MLFLEGLENLRFLGMFRIELGMWLIRQDDLMLIYIFRLGVTLMI